MSNALEKQEEYKELIAELKLTKEEEIELIGALQSIAESILNKKFMLEENDYEEK